MIKKYIHFLLFFLLSNFTINASCTEYKLLNHKYTSPDFFGADLNGHVYYDYNGNGTQDPGEPNVTNINIILLMSNGIYQAVTTDSNGNWTANLPQGNTSINLDPNDIDDNYIVTEGSNPIVISAVDGSNIFVGNIGLYYEGTVSGHVYYDDNNNGTQDSSEADMPNITINAVDGYGATHTTSTDGNGDWELTMPSSSATITIDVNDDDFPIGAAQTEGSNPIVITVQNNSTVSGGNSGFYREGTLTGHLYYDIDGNGTQTTGEQNMPGVFVTLTNTNGFSITVTTNSSGNWIAQVPSGLITGTIDVLNGNFPIGATQTEGTNPFNSTAVNNITTFTENSGFYSESTVEGHIYYDVNQNGTQDSNEPNMPNITVDITDLLGNNYSTQTDSDGNWSIIIPTGTTTITIDENDTDFPFGAIQTEGINPTTVNTLTGQIITTTPAGFFSDTDTDGDGYIDLVEEQEGSNPNNPCDPINDSSYTGYDSSNLIWANADCDGDGVTNLEEVTIGSNPFDPCSPVQNEDYIDYDATNPVWIASDCDGDGLTNGEEDAIETNPYLTDTDGDGFLDNEEVNNTTIPTDPCDPFNDISVNFDPLNTIWSEADCDGDGITNGEEYAAVTDPFDPCDPEQEPNYTGYDASNSVWANADCDGDGIDNGTEHNNGSSPYDDEDNGMIIYDGISPNGDGKNDTFTIKTIENYPKNELHIFNRWGREVYNKKSYNNTFSGFSEGTLNFKKGEKLPSGSYYYILEYNLPNGKAIKKDGTLYLN